MMAHAQSYKTLRWDRSLRSIMVELLQMVGTTPTCLKVGNRGLNAIEAQTHSANKGAADNAHIAEKYGNSTCSLGGSVPVFRRPKIA
jgi:hypothetical protein